MLLRANTESVVVQTIDQDIVLVNLDNGIYYTMTGSGAAIFSLLDSGCPQEDLIGRLSELYSEDLNTSKTSLESFVAVLLADGLVVEGLGSSGLNATDFIGNPFKPAQLDKYEDLQELLLLDPVRGLPSVDSKKIAELGHSD